MRRIASRENPTYRELRSLASASRERSLRGLAILEGVHLCEAWSRARGAPQQAVVSESATTHPEVVPLLAGLAHPPVCLPDRLFASLSSVEHGIGVLFVVETPRPEMPQVIQDDAIYLDRVQDPGNVGTLLRTCAAVGVRRVLTAPGTAACWSPKVLRAGMGAHLHLEIHEGVLWPHLAAALRIEARATAADGAVDLYAADLRRPALWVFGQEGQGVDPAILQAAALRVSVPQSPAVESLNVGVAAAVCLFEQLRQRRC